MVAIVGGNGLGLFNTSLTQLNGYGGTGSASIGNGNDRVYVNAVTGNLVIQSQDDYLASLGLDAAAVRTYNSRGFLSDDNQDGWQLSFYRKLLNLPGTGQTTAITREGGDGHRAVFNWDATAQAWISYDGSGTHDIIRRSGSNWTYEDASAGLTETYDASGRITASANREGQQLQFGYTHATNTSLITSIQDASGEKTFLSYDSASRLTQIVVGEGSETELTGGVRVRYAYHSGSNLLKDVKVDLLAPGDQTADTAANTFTTSYEYVAGSQRVNRITQTGGSELKIEYIQNGTDFRVSKLEQLTGTDGAGAAQYRTTLFTYDLNNRWTDVQDGEGLLTRYTYDSQNRLASVISPADENGFVSTTTYAYGDLKDNITSVSTTISSGVTRTVNFVYDGDGNLIESRDQLGNKVLRSYKDGQITSETVQAIVNGQPQSAQVTRYIYDAGNKQRLRFVISPEGRVTQNVYHDDTARKGLLRSTIRYTGSLYQPANPGLPETDPNYPWTEARLDTWAGGATVRNLAERVDYDYDVRGQLKTRTVFSAVLADGTGDTAKQSSSTYVYNSAGQLLSQVDPNPAGGTRATNYTYDGLGRSLTVTDVTTGRSSITTYDDAGNRVTLKSDNVGSTYRLTTVNVYNKVGELISQTQRAGNMAGNPVPVDTVLATTSYFYDDNGRLVMTVDPVGGRNFYIYDSLGRRVGEVSPEGALTETVYNGAGQVTRVIRYEGWIDVSTLYDISTGVPYDLTIEEVRGVPTAPEIDLNGDAAAGTGFTASYTEGSAAVSIVSPTLARVRDSDSAELQGATARITNLLNGSSEILSVDSALAGTYGIQAVYDSATGTLTLAGASSVANYEAVLRTLKYQNTSDAPNITSRIISVAVDDGALSSSATATVNVTAVNDRAVVDLNGGTAGTGFSATYVENSAAVSIVGSTTLTITDADHTSLLSATVTITNLLDAAAEILTVDAAVLAGKGITASYNSATGTLTLTGSSSVANYQAVLRTLKYQNTSDTPNTTSRTVHVVVSDGSDSSVTAVSTVAVQAVADPILDLNGAGTAGTGFSATYTENAAAVAIVSSGLTIVDTDSANLTGATATITNLQNGSAESLSVDTALATSSGITVSYNASTGVLTLSGSSSVANYQALLRTLKYLNSSEAPTASPARTINVTVNDGTYGSTPATATVTVVALNDAPVLDLNGATAGTGFTATYTENAAAIAIVGAGLTIVDADHANLTGATASIGSPQAGGVELLTVDTALATTYGITASFNASTGVLTLSGSSSVANYQALLRTLKYQNTSDTPSASRTVSITATDGVTVGTAATASITITAVNDAPVIDLNGASAGTGYTATYTENDPPVAIVGAGLTIIDADHVSLTGATASIGSPQAGGVEVLSVDTALATTYGITVSFNASTGVLTLSGSSSVANYQALLRTLKYQNSSENPGTGSRTVTVAVSDGTGSGSAAATITLTGANDAPVLDLNGASAGTGFSATYTEGAAAVAIVGAGLTIVDADHASLAGATAVIANLQNGSSESLSVDASLATTYGITVSYNATTGVLTLSGSSSVANYQALLRTLKYLNTSDAPGTVNRTVDVSVTDGSASSLTASATITVVAVNDAPVLDLNGASAGTGFTATYVENAVAVAIVGAGLTIVDADHANLAGATASIGSPQAGGVEILSVDTALASSYGITASYNATTGVLTLSGASSVANYQALLRSLKYQNSSDAPLASRTVSVTVTDGVTASTAASATITVTAVNDAPVLDLNGASAGTGYTATYTENNPPVAIVGTGLTIIDADSATLAGATATITNPQNGTAETLGVDPALASSYGISVSYNSSTGVLSLSGSSSVANYQALLRTLTYRNASEAPTASPNRSITVTVSDGAATSNTATATITVIAVNDPPVIDLNGAAAGTGFTASYTENAAAVGIVGADLTLADADHANLSGATASITNLQDGSSESLSVDALLAASYGIATSYNSATGVLTLSGSSSLANYQALLRTLKYENSSENPGAVAREIDVAVTDGVTASAAARTVVSVVPVNDAPVLDFNSTTSGTDHVVVMPSGLNVTIGGLVQISDPDNTMLTSAEARIVGVAVLAENLSITGSANISASYFAGTLTLTGTATVAEYKAVLDTLQYNRTLLGAVMLTDRTVEVTVYDGALNSNTSTITVLRRGSSLPSGASAMAAPMALSAEPMSASSVTVTRSFTGVQRITDYVYDEAGRQIFQVTDDTEKVGGVDTRKRVVTEKEYDGASRVIQETAFSRRVDADAPLTEQGLRGIVETSPYTTDPNRVSRYFYDGDGRLLAVLDGEGYLREQTYDAAGRQVTETRYATQIVNATALATGTLPTLRGLAGSSAANQVARNIYDGRGQLTATIDAESYLTTYLYDAVGNRTEERRFGGTVVYDPAKSIDTLETEARNATPAGTQTLAIKRTSYDSLSRVKDVSDIWIPNAAEILLSKTGYEYNAVSGFLERTIRGVDAGAGSSEYRATTYTYDDLGRVRTEKDAVASADASVPVTATNLYDNAGRRIKTTDGSGKVSFFFYDQDGRLRYTVTTASVATEGEVTELVYNSFGEVTRTIQHAERLVLNTAGSPVNETTSLAVLAGKLNAGNPRNRVTDTGYTLAGLAKKQIDAEGYITERIYSAFGQLATQLSPVRTSGASALAQRTDTWTYDRRGLQLKATVDDVAGGLRLAETRSLDAFGRIWRTQDALNRAWLTGYDRLGRATSTTDPLTFGDAMTYDAYGRVLTMQDKLGKVTSYRYEMGAGSRSMIVTTPEQVRTTTVYDRHGSELRIELLNNGATEVTAFTYDRNGRLRSSTMDKGDATRLNLTKTSDYDKKGRLIGTIDQEGVRTSYTYDAANRVLSRVVDPVSFENPDGTMGSKPSGLNLETKFEYDAFGAAVKTTDPEGVVTETIYDERGQALAVIVDTVDRGAGKPSPLQIATTYTYAPSGTRLTVEEGRIAAKDGTGQWDFSLFGTPQRVTTYEYDKAGRVVREIVDPASYLNVSGSTVAKAGALGLTTQNAYDANGNLIARTDANNNVWRKFYDELNREVFSVDPEKGLTEKVYDKLGRLVRTVRYANVLGLALSDGTATSAVRTAVNAVGFKDASVDRATRMVYDADGRQVYQIDALGQISELRYDAGGRVIESIRYHGPVDTSLLSDAPEKDDITVVAHAEDRHSHQVYDGAGRRVYDIDAMHNLVRYQYDRTGRVINTTRFANALDPEVTLDKGTLDGQIAALADADNDRVTRSFYDAAGRERYILRTKSGTDSSYASYITERRYDKLGQVTEEYRYYKEMNFTSDRPTLTAINQQIAGRTDSVHDQKSVRIYDGAGRLLSSTDAYGKTESFTYTAIGKKESFTNQNGARWDYVYDGAGRLIEELTPEVETSQLNVSGALPVFSQATARLSTKLIYDGQGNLLHRIENAGASDRTKSRVTSYLYDRVGRQVQTRNASVVTIGGLTYGSQVKVYDAATDAIGNYVNHSQQNATLISTTLYNAFGDAIVGRDAGGSFAYKSYDRNGRLIAEIGATGHVTRYEYDAFGNQTKLSRYGDDIDSTDSVNGGTVTLATRQQTLKTQIDSVQLGQALPSTLQSTALLAWRKADALIGAISSTDVRTIQTRYDLLDRKSEVKQPTVDVYQTSETAAAQARPATPTTTFLYDAFGNVVKKSVLSFAGSSAPQDRISDTYSYYDRLGNRTAQIDAMGYLSKWEYNANGQVTRSLEWADALTPGTWSEQGYIEPAVAAPNYGALSAGPQTLWPSNFSAGLTGMSPSGTATAAPYFTTSSGRLVVANTYSQSTAQSVGLVGDRSYAASAEPVFRFTFSLPATGTLVGKSIGISNSLNPGSHYVQHYLRFSERGITFSADDGSGYFEGPPLDVSRPATYVLEFVVDAGGSTAYLYLDGQARDSGIRDRLDYIGTTPVSGLRAAVGASRMTSGTPSGGDAAISIHSIVELDGTSVTSSLDAMKARQVRNVREAVSDYDALGRQISIKKVGVTKTEYLAAGRLAQHVADEAIGMAYDAVGNVISTTDAEGAKTLHFFDSLGRRVYEIGPSISGFAAGQTSSVASPATLSSLTRHWYDALGSEVATTKYANGTTRTAAQASCLDLPTQPAANANDQVTYEARDILGRAVAAIDGMGNRSDQAFDAFGNLAKLWQNYDRLDGTTGRKAIIYTYNGRGDQIERKEREEDGSYSRFISDYNAYGEMEASRVISTTVNGETLYDYDAGGNLWRTTEGGKTTVILRDLQGNITARFESPDLDLLTLSKASDVLNLPQASLRKTEMVYDANDRMVFQRKPTFTSNSTMASNVAPVVYHPDETHARIRFSGEIQKGATLTIDILPPGATQWISRPMLLQTSTTSADIYYYVDVTGYAEGQYSYKITHRIPERTAPLEISSGKMQLYGAGIARTRSPDPKLVGSIGSINGEPALILTPAQAGDANGLTAVELYYSYEGVRSIRLSVRSMGNGTYGVELPGEVGAFPAVYGFGVRPIGTSFSEVDTFVVPTTNPPVTTATGSSKALINALFGGTLAHASIPSGMRLQSFLVRPAGMSSVDYQAIPLPVNGVISVHSLLGYLNGQFDYKAVFVNAQGAAFNLSGLPGGNSSGELVGAYRATGIYGSVDATPLGLPAATLNAPTLDWTYDRWGNVISQVDEAGIQTAFRYDESSRLIEDRHFNIRTVDLRGDVTIGETARYYAYDSNGREIAVADANGNVNFKTYNALGKIAVEKTGGGADTSYFYDTFGRLNRKRDPLLYYTYFVHDKNDNVLQERNPATISLYHYDALGRRDIASGVSYVYDARNNVTLKWERGLDANGVEERYTTEYSYDALSRKIYERDPNSYYQQWSYNQHGQMLTSQGLDQVLTRHYYNNAADKTAEVREEKVFDRSGNIVVDPSYRLYSYYENGLLKSLSDPALVRSSAIALGLSADGTAILEDGSSDDQVIRLTQYAYDIAGRLVHERFSGRQGGAQQSAVYSYDSAGRLSGVTDFGGRVSYSYDANGNRRSIRVEKNRDTDSHFYLFDYDSNDRMTVNMEGDISSAGVLSRGAWTILEYDIAGQRLRSSQYSNGSSAQTGLTDEDKVKVRSFSQPVTVQKLSYDGNRRLRGTWNGSGTMTSWRDYDDYNRVKTYITYGSQTVTRNYDYNELTSRFKTTTETTGSSTVTTAYTYYAGGQLKQIRATKPSTPGVTYKYFYQNGTNGYLENEIEAWTDGTSFATRTIENYDFRDNLTGVLTWTDTRFFDHNQSGQMLAKRRAHEDSGTTRFIYFGQQHLGSHFTPTGQPTQYSFGVLPSPVDDESLGVTPGIYVVQSATDSMQSIAQAVYGDAKLWYLIADANTASDTQDLYVGQILTIPNRIVTARNAADTFTPFNQAKAVGDLAPPAPPPPPPKQKCNVLAAVVMIVAVVVTVWTAGATSGWAAAAASAVQGAVGAGTLGAVAAGVTYVGVSAALGAASAALGNIAAQGTSMALGLQDSFSWSAVGDQAISGAVSSGFTAGFGLAGFDWGGAGGFSYSGIAQGALSSAISQGVNIALGNQEKFSWAQVAAAGAVSGFTGTTGDAKLDAASGASVAPAATFSQNFSRSFFSGLARDTITMALEGRGTIDLLNIAADAFGNALGNSLLSMSQGKAGKELGDDDGSGDGPQGGVGDRVVVVEAIGPADYESSVLTSPGTMDSDGSMVAPTDSMGGLIAAENLRGEPEISPKAAQVEARVEVDLLNAVQTIGSTTLTADLGLSGGGGGIFGQDQLFGSGYGFGGSDGYAPADLSGVSGIGQGLGDAGYGLLIKNPELIKQWESTTSAWTQRGGFTKGAQAMLEAEGILVIGTPNPTPAGSWGKSSGVTAEKANNHNGRLAENAIADRYRQQGLTVDTQVSTMDGKRIVDVAVDIPAADPRNNQRLEIESKAKRVSNSAEYREQAMKDGAALKSNQAVRKAGRVLEGVGRVAKPVGVVLDAIEIGQAYGADGGRVGTNTGRAVSGVAGGAAGGWGGAVAGATLGATVGSAVPIVGTVVGGVVGGIAGGILGGWGGTKIGQGTFNYLSRLSR
jgi:YD repeat-containing protein